MSILAHFSTLKSSVFSFLQGSQLCYGYYVDGGGGGDLIGGLVGNQVSVDVIVTSSYGFGSLVGGETTSTAGTPPSGVSNANQLTLGNAGSVWSNAASNTAGAWQFASNVSAPKLLYNDYDDGTNDMFGCAGSSATIIIPNCGSLIPGQ